MKKSAVVVAADVLAPERTTAQQLQGPLGKRSAYGGFQKRFFAVNNQYLNYFASKKMKVLKASCDLTLLEEDPSLVGRFGEFILKLPEGTVHLKARNLAEAEGWIRCLSERRAFFLDGLGSHEATIEVDKAEPGSAQAEIPEDTPGSEAKNVDDKDTIKTTSSKDFKGVGSRIKRVLGAGSNRNISWELEAANNCSKSGWLLKKSPSRFKAWQSRYCRLIDGALYYYKSEKTGSDNFQGRISLDTAFQISIPGWEGPDEIQLLTNLRSYEFKADSVELANEWVRALVEERERVKKDRKAHLDKLTALLEKDNESVTKLAEEERRQELQRVPAWMVEWDRMDPLERVGKLQTKLEAKFHCEEFGLNNTLVATTGLLEELDELAAECINEVHNRTDILIGYMRVYHTRIEHEIGVFLVGEYFEQLSIHDMLRLMDLITAYEDFFNRITAGDQGREIKEQLPPFSMDDSVERMAARYLCELQDSLGTWVENVIRATFSRGDSCIELVSQEDSMLCTSAPVDIFNFINETLMMAKACGVDQVQGAVLSCCLVAIADYTTSLVCSIQESHESSTVTKDLRFLCALTNDCATVVDLLDDLERGEFGDQASGLGLDWESIRAKYDQTAIEMIHSILEMIHADLEPLRVTLFTSAHLDVSRDDIGANTMARVAATVQDYLEDLKQFLQPVYFTKLAKILVRDLVVEYCGRAVSLSLVSTNPLMFAREVLPPKGAPKVTVRSKFSPLKAKSALSLDDIFHVKADRDSTMSVLSSFVSNPEKLFGAEFVLWNDLLDLLTVSPQFYPSAVYKMCLVQGSAVEDAVVSTALCCLSLREDVSSAQASEIRMAIATTIHDAVAAEENKSEDEKMKATLLGRGSVYHQLWPERVFCENNMPPAKKSPERKSRASIALFKPDSESGSRRKLIARVTRSLSKQVSGRSRSKSRSIMSDSSSVASDDIGRPRRTSLLNAVANDISEDAAIARKQQRKVKLDVSEDIRDVDLHGYLDKRSPTPPHLWQRRWFLVHKALDEATNSWRIALSWHKTHNSPVKSRLFLDQVDRIELSSPIPVRLAADGFTLILEKKKFSRRLIRDTLYEFRVITPFRTYVLRLPSMSETVTWVNGLNKACREARNLASKASYAVPPSIGEMDVSQLRAICLSKGLMVSVSATRDELIAYYTEDCNTQYDKNEIAQQVGHEEKTKLLSTKSVRELRDSCLQDGLDDSKCVEKSDLIALVAEKGKVAREEEEATFRQLVARGLCLLDEEGDLDRNVEMATAIFDQVIRQSHEAGFALIEARAMHGLATAYSLSDDRRAAAPLMFEMCSNIFLEAGEFSDARSCAMDASELYRITGQVEDAIRTLVDFDTKTKSLEFSTDIEALRASLLPPEPKKDRFSQLAQFFLS